MKCPSCGHQEDRVVDSRPAEEGSAIRRRRECLVCKQRFTTYEKVENLPFYVIKKDGSRESFDRQKLMNGLTKACQKRAVSVADLERIVLAVEQACASHLNREIESREIGELLMQHLKELDKVAYVRFASVYREFADLDSFINEMKVLVDRADMKRGGEGESEEKP